MGVELDDWRARGADDKLARYLLLLVVVVDAAKRSERRGGKERAIQSKREVAILAADGLVDGDQKDAVWEAALDLDLVQLAGDGREHLAAAQHLLPEILQLGYAVFPVADELLQHACQQRRCFDEIEPHTASESLLGERAGAVQEQPQLFAGEEVHGDLTGQ